MMDYNGAFEAFRVHRVNNQWTNRPPLATPIQPAIFLCWEYCFSKANDSSMGKKSNYVKIRRYAEIRVHFHQILTNNSGNELQLREEVNSEGVTL